MPQSKKKDWNRLYTEYQSSGLAKKAFAEMNNLSVNMTYKKFLEIEKQTSEIYHCTSSTDGQPSFIQVQLQEKAELSKLSEITLDFHSFSIRVDHNTDLDFLAQIIRKVVPLC